MPIYKNKKTKKYTVRINYTNKEGKAATIYGTADTYNQALDKYQELYAHRYYSTKTTLKELIEYFLIDCKVKNKMSTYKTATCLASTMLKTMDGDMRIDKITPMYIRNWQNNLLKKGYAISYVHAINAKLSTIFNYAINYYGLKENPVQKAGTLASKSNEEKKFWTFEQFQLFINAVDKEEHISCWVVFNLLFYTGARLGEIFALYPEDIDLKNKCIHITKTYIKVKGIGYLTEPKTKHSIRDVKIPDFLCEILENYIKRLPSMKLRLFFNIYATTLDRVKKEICEKVGLPYIRVHDFRHSAISYLISENVPILEISRRMGHSSPAMTYGVYAHLYIDKDKKIADAIDKDLASLELP